MTITVRTVGRFKEVTFHDFENEEVRAYSGLLDNAGAEQLSQQLRQVADTLGAQNFIDENQTLLPFLGLPRSARALTSA